MPIVATMSKAQTVRRLRYQSFVLNHKFLLERYMDGVSQRDRMLTVAKLSNAQAFQRLWSQAFVLIHKYAGKQKNSQARQETNPNSSLQLELLLLFFLGLSDKVQQDLATRYSRQRLKRPTRNQSATDYVSPCPNRRVRLVMRLAHAYYWQQVLFITKHGCSQVHFRRRPHVTIVTSWRWLLCPFPPRGALVMHVWSSVSDRWLLGNCRVPRKGDEVGGLLIFFFFAYWIWVKCQHYRIFLFLNHFMGTLWSSSFF